MVGGYNGESSNLVAGSDEENTNSMKEGSK